MVVTGVIIILLWWQNQQYGPNNSILRVRFQCCFFFHFFNIENSGEFFFELAKLVKFTLEKKIQFFPNFLFFIIIFSFVFLPLSSFLCHLA
jgi:hypothetical protein